MVSRTADIDDGSNGFLAIPSFTIKGDLVVIAESEDYAPFRMKGKKIKPLFLAELLFKHFPAVHVIDLNGLLKGNPNLGFIRGASDMGEVWVDPGIVRADPCIDMFMAGAAQTVVTSRAVGGLKEVVNAFEFSENIVFQVDIDGSRVISGSKTLSSMSLVKLIEEVVDIGIYQFILADYSRLDSSKGPDLELVGKLVERFQGDIELYPGVGVAPRHLPELEEAGAAGAVLDLRAVLEDKGLAV